MSEFSRYESNCFEGEVDEAVEDEPEEGVIGMGSGRDFTEMLEPETFFTMP